MVIISSSIKTLSHSFRSSSRSSFLYLGRCKERIVGGILALFKETDEEDHETYPRWHELNTAAPGYLCCKSLRNLDFSDSFGFITVLAESVDDFPKLISMISAGSCYKLIIGISALSDINKMFTLLVKH